MTIKDILNFLSEHPISFTVPRVDARSNNYKMIEERYIALRNFIEWLLDNQHEFSRTQIKFTTQSLPELVQILYSSYEDSIIINYNDKIFNSIVKTIDVKNMLENLVEQMSLYWPNIKDQYMYYKKDISSYKDDINMLKIFEIVAPHKMLCYDDEIK